MTSPIPLIELPWFIQNDIFKYMNPISRISLRQCSMRMRQIVNDWELPYKRIDLYLSKDTVRMTLIIDSDQESVVNYRREAVDNEENCVSGEDYFQRCTIDFCGIVANPRVTVDVMYIVAHRYVRVFIQCIAEQMGVFGEQMNVKHLLLFSPTRQDEQLSLLSMIRPGFLEYMLLWPIDDENLDQVTATEQWNRLREVDIENTFPDMDPFEVPIKKFAHMRKVVMVCRSLTFGDAWKIIKAAIRQGDEFISFRIEICSTTKTTRRLIRWLIRLQNPNNKLLISITKHAFSVLRPRS